MSDVVAYLVTQVLAVLEKVGEAGIRRPDLRALVSVSSGELWGQVLGALRQHPKVVIDGRGPGLRYFHYTYRLEPQHRALNLGSSECEGLRLRVLVRMRNGEPLASKEGQDLTGLRRDPFRRLMYSLVDAGDVVFEGKKRSRVWRLAA